MPEEGFNTPSTQPGPQTAADVLNALLPKYPHMAAITSATTGTPGIAGINPSLLKSFRSFQYSMPEQNIALEFTSLAQIDEATKDISNQYDLIFIDPWHTYEDSLLALEIAMRLAKPNSMIVMHDCLAREASLSAEYIPGAWSGVTCFVFKEFAKTVRREYFVLDRNHGVGILGPLLRSNSPTLDTLDLEKLKAEESQKLSEYWKDPRAFMRGISSTSFNEAIQKIEVGRDPTPFVTLNPSEPELPPKVNPDEAHIVNLNDELLSELNAIKNSRIWRATRNYRKLRGIPRKLKVRQTPPPLHFISERIINPSAKHHVILVGIHSDDWMVALSPNSDIWSSFSHVHKISHYSTLPETSRKVKQLSVIPFMEEDALRVPSWAPVLKSPNSLIEQLQNKKLFKGLMEKNSLSELLPCHYENIDEVIYPAVIKSPIGAGGSSVRLVKNITELKNFVSSQELNLADLVIQEFIPGVDEYVAHFVSKNGEVLYEKYYSFKLQQSTSIRTAETTQRSSMIELSKNYSQIFHSILKAIQYSGPINIDFKIQNAKIRIFEMNPRLGGSLMVEQNQADLVACLKALLPVLS